MSKMAAKATILYGECDSEVLRHEAAVMEKAGYSVRQAVGRKEMEQILRQEKFDLVVLGHTLSRDDRHHLPYMAKKSSSATRVLVIHASGKHHEVDAAIDSRHGAEVLLNALAELLEPAYA